MQSLYLFCVILLFTVSTALGGEVKEVNWGTEEWKGFTDKNGKGIYTKLLKNIFEHEGIKLNITYMPFARTLHLVQIHKLDIAGGIAKDKEKNKLYLQANYPIYVPSISVFFKTETTRNWEGAKTLKGSQLVGTTGVAAVVGLEKEKVLIVDSRDQALMMVVKGRSKYYLDEPKMLNKTMQTNKSHFNRGEYSLKTIHGGGLHMIAPNSEKGKKIIAIYDKGMKRLYESGELKKLYDAHGLPMPPLGKY